MDAAPALQIGKGIRMLSLDGTDPGITDVSQLTLLQEIMERIEALCGLDETPPPYKYFELIGGSGMGGVFAILLARWHLTVKETLSVYITLHNTVFSSESWSKNDSDVVANTTLLRDTIRKVAYEFHKDVDEDLVSRTAESCKGFLCATNPENMSFPRLFRTYKARSNRTPDCSVVESLLISIAGDPYTAPISLGQPPVQFMSAVRRVANPSLELLNEAQAVFDVTTDAACLVSIGAGSRAPLEAGSIDNLSKDPEQVNQELERRCAGSKDLFFRLNVSHGLEHIEQGSDALSKIVTHTTQYLSTEETAAKMERVVKSLVQRPESISLEKMTSIANNESEGIYTTKPQLPPKPIRLFGRDREVDIIVEILIGPAPARVAILGLGGIGKTSVALNVLHHVEIASRYSGRYFVACEGVTSVELLLNAVADVLHIPPSRRDVNLMDLIKRRLSERPSILCLDNFETPWDSRSTRPEIESCLAQLAGPNTAAVLVTMRGAQRPAQSLIEWSKPYLEQLRPLEEDPSVRLFEEIGNTKLDEFSQKLLYAVDGIPLAITLLAHLVQDTFESTEAIWNRWCAERTSILENGGNDKLSRLDTSIALSVNSPRVTSSARRVLHMLAILPDGLNTLDVWLEELHQRLPDITLKRELLSLQRAALVAPSSSSMQARYIMLEPIRQYVLQNIDVNNNLRSNLVQTSVNMMVEHWDFMSSTCRSIIQPDFLNVHAVLVYGFSEGTDVKDIAQAARIYTDWASYLNIYSEEIIQMALSHPSLTQNEHVDCLRSLGYVQYWKNDYKRAEESYSNALSIAGEARYVAGEAESHKNIGELQMRRYDLDGAEHSLKEALRLHTEAQDVVGQANDLQNLGEVQMRRDDLDGAQHSLKEALRLHTEAQSVIGQANDLQSIGELQMRQDDLNGAEHSLKEALRLHTEAEAVLGQANDLQHIGKLQMQRYKFDDAEHFLKGALRLHTKAQDVVGQANDFRNLGEVQMRRDDLDGAEYSLEEALRLHTEAQSVLGIGNDLNNIGQMKMRRDNLDDAEQSFREALRLHTEAQDIVWQANDLDFIGQVKRQRDDLDGAEQSFRESLRLYTEARDLYSQKILLGRIGEVQQQRGDLDGAEKTFEEARRIHEKAPKATSSTVLRHHSWKPTGFVRKLKVLFSKRRAFKLTESNE